MYNPELFPFDVNPLAFNWVWDIAAALSLFKTCSLFVKLPELYTLKLFVIPPSGCWEYRIPASLVLSIPDVKNTPNDSAVPLNIWEASPPSPSGNKLLYSLDAPTANIFPFIIPLFIVFSPPYIPSVNVGEELFKAL